MRWTAKTDPDVPVWLWPLVPFVLASCVMVLLLEAAIVRVMDAKRAMFGPTDEWGRWFAWHPVRLPPLRLPPHGNQVVWLEWIERRTLRYGPGGQIEVQVRVPDRASTVTPA